MMVYVCRDGVDLGEWEEREFRDKVFNGEILPTDYYFSEGFADWKPVRDYQIGARTIRLDPPPP